MATLEVFPLTYESVMALYELEIALLNIHNKVYTRPYGYTETSSDGVDVYSKKGDIMFNIPSDNVKSAHRLLGALVDKAKNIRP